MRFKNVIFSMLLASSIEAQPLTPSELAWNSNTNASSLACTPVFSTNMILFVYTNSSSIIDLAGSGGLFFDVTMPTNGFLQAFHNTGRVTYVETNGAATVDFFKFGIQSFGSCISTSSVTINIVDTNSQCTVNPPGSGIYTNVVVVPSLGKSLICLSWTNSSCVYTQQCQNPMGSGETVFWTDLNSACGSIYLCVSNCAVSNYCNLGEAIVAGAGSADANGVYYREPAADNQPPISGAHPFYFAYTNIHGMEFFQEEQPPYGNSWDYQKDVWYEIEGVDTLYYTTNFVGTGTGYSQCNITNLPPSAWNDGTGNIHNLPPPNVILIVTNNQSNLCP